MTSQKFAAALLALPLITSAQNGLIISQVQISTVRNLRAVAAQKGDGSIPCSTPDLDQHPSAQDYCIQISNILNPLSVPTSFATYRLRQSWFSSVLATVAESRLDENNSPAPSSSGSTSAVVRAGISDVLGIALEAGAITQTQNGSTLTLQGNALSLHRFLKDQDVFQYCPDGGVKCFGPFDAFLSGLSGSAALTLSNTSIQSVTGTVAGSMSTTPASATASIQNSTSHLTGFTVRYQIFNDLDLRSKMYVTAWKKAMQDKTVLDKAAAADKNAGPAFKWLDANSDEFRKWIIDAIAQVRTVLEDSSKTDADVANTVGQQWDLLVENPKFKPDMNALKTFLQAVNLYMVSRDAALAAARQQTASGVTIEYTYSRPANQPTLSNARLAYTLRPGTNASTGATGGDSALTFNLAADFYNTAPAGTGAFRDFQAGLQLDHHFGTNIGTLAGYYQYQNQPAAIKIGMGNLAPNTNIVLPGPAATLLAPKGNLAVAQAKITFTLKSGSQLPVGVTWSNRTELIKANEVRGHVGFDFDWSSLLLGKKAGQ